MSDPQDIYDQYVNKYGYAPKLPRHLIAFAKQYGATLKYTGAKKIITSNASKTVVKRSESESTALSTQSIMETKEQQTITINVQNNPDPLLSSTNNDEKDMQLQLECVEAAQPIMCRVNFECSTEQAKQQIMCALSTFVKIQTDTPYAGTITYHFTCPNPVKYPLKLEFTELYYDEKVYWLHGKNPKFGSAFFKAFKEENRKSRHFITCGDHMSEYVRKVNAMLDSTFPKTEAGFLLNDKYLECLDKADATKMMFKLDITAPKYHKGRKENVALIISMINKLSLFAKESFAVMFHCHRIQEKIYPDQLELICTWPKAEFLVCFLQNESVESILTEFKHLMIEHTEKESNRKKHCLCELYGENVTNDVMECVGNIFGDISVVKQVKSDIGYILHEKANSKYLK